MSISDDYALKGSHLQCFLMLCDKERIREELLPEELLQPEILSVSVETTAEQDSSSF